jgi:hypothetical protein
VASWLSGKTFWKNFSIFGERGLARFSPMDTTKLGTVMDVYVVYFVGQTAQSTTTVPDTFYPSREFRADPLKLKRLRVAASLTVKELIELADLDRTTVGKTLRGDPVFLKSLALVGSRVFNIENPLELLHPDELHALGIQTAVPAAGHVLEWEIERYLSGWEKTTNGLQYQAVKLRHRYLKNRLARGKCFELRYLTGTEKKRVEQYLLRHVEH